MTRMGMDVAAVEQVARNITAQADRLNQLSGQIGRSVTQLNNLWYGTDSQHLVHTRWPQNRAALASAETVLRSMARSLRMHATEQRRASGAGGGALSALARGPSGGTAHGGTRQVDDHSRSALSALRDWWQDPLSNTSYIDRAVRGSATVGLGPAIGSGFGQVGSVALRGVSRRDLFELIPGVGKLTLLQDAGEVIAGHRPWSDLIGPLGSTALGVAGKASKALAAKAAAPLYLGSVAIKITDFAAKEAAKGDFSAAGRQQVADYIWSNPTEAAKAAAESVVEALPKIAKAFWPF